MVTQAIIRPLGIRRPAGQPVSLGVTGPVEYGPPLARFLDTMDRIRILEQDAAFSQPGKAGSKNGCVTWTGGKGGPFRNGWTGELLNTNYLLRSQEFDSATWTKTNATLTLAQLGPDNRLSATKLAATATGAISLRQTITVAAATTYTLSCFFKRGDAAFAVLAVDDGTDTNVRKQYFNLATGAVASTVQTGTYAKVSANMIDQALGDGTYRCDLTITTPAGTTARIYAGLADVDGTDSLTAAKFATVWGAQFELGNVATAYVPTMAAAQAHCVYTRQAFPGFSVPRIPQVVGSALDAPFRHDYRLGYNLLVNSAWDGAVAGDPGTDPTGWTALDVGAGTLAVPLAGQVTFIATNATDQRGIYQQVTVAANTTYLASARVTAMTGGPLRVSEMVSWATIPAGATVAYYKNGVLGDATTTADVGDTIAAALIVAGTAGTGRAYLGANVTASVTPACSVTLTEPQVEPGTVRSVYTPTTTAAIQAVVCEPVRASEDGVFAMFHAQGARTNLIPAMNSGGQTTSTLTGLARTVVENTATDAHYRIPSAAFSLVDGTTYAIRATIYRAAGARHAGLYVGRSGQAAGFKLNLDTGEAESYSAGGAVVAGLVSTPLGAGRYMVTCTVTNAAWGGTILPYFTLRNTAAATITPTYEGDGASGVTFENVTLEAATFPGLPLGEGVALTAQVVQWNLARLTGQTGECATAESPYLWAAGAGAAHPAGGTRRTITGLPGYIGRDSGDIALRIDGGTPLASASALADASGVVRLLDAAWDAASLRLYRGAVLIASDATLSPPWQTSGVLTIACNGASNQWFGAVAPFLFNGRTFTDGERTMLAAGLARTLATAA